MTGGIRHLISVDDLELGAIEEVLARASELAAGSAPQPVGAGGALGLLFLASSLRTRVGFAVAGAAIGLTPVTIDEVRFEPGMTQAESFADMIRVLTGQCSAVVLRTPDSLDRALIDREAMAPVVNGGDGWNEHPSQALIDLFTITHLVPSPGPLRIGIVGDLRMHVSRSLVALLAAAQVDVAELRLIAPPGRDDLGFAVPSLLAAQVERRDHWDVGGLDVVYLAGLPEGAGALHLDGDARARFALDARRASELADGVRVLCPLPRIDEIVDDAREHASVRIFEQSDAGRWVRTALLERLLG